MHPTQASVRNSLLRAMMPEDFARLAPYLVQVDLPRRMNLIEEGHIIEKVYFPVSGLASIVSLTPDREMIEVGMFGYEGSSDFVLDAGKDRVPLRTFMQIAGQGWVMDAIPFAEAVDESKTLLKIILRLDEYKAIQFAYTALSHGSYKISERLARWILMAQDRMGDEFPTSHEFLSTMLAVRRAGVTEAIHIVEGHHAIKSTRSRIKVVNREKLIELAAGSYGVPEAEYERLIGPFRGMVA